MEAKRALDEALKMLGMISLKGDAVDVMAAAKGNIRAAIAQLEEKMTEAEPMTKEVGV